MIRRWKIGRLVIASRSHSDEVGRRKASSVHFNESGNMMSFAITLHTYMALGDFQSVPFQGCEPMISEIIE